MTFQKYRLDALTTELWETRGEQGHILGSDVCDTCPAILQGSTCRNDNSEKSSEKLRCFSLYCSG